MTVLAFLNPPISPKLGMSPNLPLILDRRHIQTRPPSLQNLIPRVYTLRSTPRHSTHSPILQMTATSPSPDPIPGKSITAAIPMLIPKLRVYYGTLYRDLLRRENLFSRLQSYKFCVTPNTE